MANLTGVYSLDPEARRQFLKSAEARMASYQGSPIRRFENGALSLIWSAPAVFPVSIQCVGSQGRIDFGPVTETGATAQDSPAGAGGFHASAVFSEREIRIGSDTFGLFPLYFCETGSEFTFATAPYLLADAPGFKREVEPVSLAMLLLLGVLPGARTLLKGLRRVGPFTEIKWAPAEGSREIAVRPIHASDRFFGEPFERNLARVDEVLKSAVDSNLKGVSEAAFLLSGGLDARLLAGYVAERKDVNVHALTQGREMDAEVHCAKKAANELRWPHEIFAEDEEAIETLADLKIDHEFLCGGFGLTFFPQLTPRIGGGAALSGAYGDMVLGCAELGNGWRDRYDVASHLKACFHPYFTPELLRQMPLSTKFQDAVSAAEEEIRSLYHRFSGLPFQKAWQFDFLAIDRLKVVFPRYMAFGGVPLIPFADRSLFETVAGLPPEHLASRRMERELLIRRFPKLAALSADRNRRVPVPLLSFGRCIRAKGIPNAQKMEAIKSHVSSRIMAPWGRLRDKLGGTESRFYYRILDVNRPPWKRLRTKALKGRRLLAEWIKPETLDQWLPDANATIHARDTIYHAQKTRLLTGLALWADRVL